MFSIKKQYLHQTCFSYFSAEDFVQTPIYSLMEKAYLNILNNFDTLDEHYPDFVSFFQCRVLPIALQSGNFNQDLVRVAPTAFPPSVDPSEVNFVSKTVSDKIFLLLFFSTIFLSFLILFILHFLNWLSPFFLKFLLQSCCWFLVVRLFVK